MKYYCPFCKKEFNEWGIKYYSRNENRIVCLGGCNTDKEKMIKIQEKMPRCPQCKKTPVYCVCKEFEYNPNINAYIKTS